VDSPSPPLRSALGPSASAKRYTPQESQLQTASVRRVRIDTSSRIQPSHASSRRAPQRSLLQQRPSYSSAPRVHPLTREIVRSVADLPPQQRTRMRKCVASSCRFDLRTIDSQRCPTQQRFSNPLLEAAAAVHRQFTTASSTSRAASECTSSQPTIHSSRPGGRDPWSLVHSNQSLSKIIRREQIVEIHREPQPNRNDPGWRRASVAAREWAASNATDRMERVSQDPL
jgi:hypothetical protein